MAVLRNRQNILNIPLTQVTTLTDAFNTIKSNGSYDTFIKRHMTAMMTPTPTGSQSNAAHSGPIFLPWHRAALWELENLILSVAPSLPGLPYWKWAAEGPLNGGYPARSKLWTSSYIGTDGDPANGDRVLNGPFKNWHALVYNNTTGAFSVRSTPGLVRRLGRDSAGSSTLPDQKQVDDLFTYTTYDVPPYGPNTSSFRSRMEGWNAGTRLHNQVHRWIGGDMLAGTSPNDPVFWLHHANVDRLWWLWQTGTSPMRPYQPTAASGPVGQRVTDTMKFLSSTTWTPAKVLTITDATNLGYNYS